MAFPTTLDSFSEPPSPTTTALGDVTYPHTAHHTALGNAIEAIEAKVGIDASADTDSLDYRVAALEGGGGGGGGDVTLIASSTLGSDQGSVVFSSIPGTFSNLKLVLTCRQTKAATTAGLNLRVNNDSGGNYTNGTTYIAAGNVPAASATAGRAGSAVIWFPGYQQTTFHKTLIWQVAYDNTVANGAYGWNSTSAITRIDVIADTNNFKTGSTFSLYGLT